MNSECVEFLRCCFSLAAVCSLCWQLIFLACFWCALQLPEHYRDVKTAPRCAVLMVRKGIPAFIWKLRGQWSNPNIMLPASAKNRHWITCRTAEMEIYLFRVAVLKMGSRYRQRAMRGESRGSSAKSLSYPLECHKSQLCFTIMAACHGSPSCCIRGALMSVMSFLSMCSPDWGWNTTQTPSDQSGA